MVNFCCNFQTSTVNIVPQKLIERSRGVHEECYWNPAPHNKVMHTLGCQMLRYEWANSYTF